MNNCPGYFILNLSSITEIKIDTIKLYMRTLQIAARMQDFTIQAAVKKELLILMIKDIVLSYNGIKFKSKSKIECFNNGKSKLQ